MAHVNHIKSNFKGDFEHVLGQKMVISGANETGKSRIVDAISLALTGKPRSSFIGTREHDLLALKPSGAQQLFSHVTLNTGEQCQWHCSGSTARAQRAVWTRPTSADPGEIVSDLVTALMAGNGARLREAIMERAENMLDRRHVVEGAPEGLRKDIESAIRGVHVGDGAVPLSALLAAVKAIDAKRKGLTKTVKSMQERLEGIVEEPLTDEEIEDLARLRRVLTGEAPGPPPDIDAIKREVERLRAAAIAKQGELERLGQPGTPSTEAYDLLSTAHRLAELITARIRAAQATRARCLICGSQAELSAIAEQENKLTEALTGLERARQVHNERADCILRLGDINVEIARAAARLKKAEETIVQQRQKPDGNAREVYEELVARQRVVSEALGLREALLKTDVDSRNMTSVSKYLTEVSRKTLTQVQDAFVEKLNGALPEEYEAGLALKAGSRDVCDLMINGKHIAGASGALRAIVAVAACRALLNGSQAPVRLAIADETGLDRQHLGALMSTMDAVIDAGSATQGIICVVEPYYKQSEMPPGWGLLAL